MTPRLSYRGRQIQLRDQAYIFPHRSFRAGPMLGWLEGLQPDPGTNLLHSQYGESLAPRSALSQMPECPPSGSLLAKDIISLEGSPW